MMSDDICSQATLFAYDFPSHVFTNNVSVKNRREEQILFLCVSAFIFHPKMMEIKIGSLLWLHSTGAWGAGGR